MLKEERKRKERNDTMQGSISLKLGANHRDSSIKVGHMVQSMLYTSKKLLKKLGVGHKTVYEIDPRSWVTVHSFCYYFTVLG